MEESNPKRLQRLQMMGKAREDNDNVMIVFLIIICQLPVTCKRLTISCKWTTTAIVSNTMSTFCILHTVVAEEHSG